MQENAWEYEENACEYEGKGEHAQEYLGIQLITREYEETRFYLGMRTNMREYE